MNNASARRASLRRICKTNRQAHIEQQLSIVIRTLVELRHEHMNTDTEHVYLNMYKDVHKAIDEYKDSMGLEK